MQSMIKLAFYLCVGCFVMSSGTPYGNRHHFIESPKLSSWGDWGKLEHCPSDQVVVGMKLKVHDHQGVKDDSGLNAVKFYCQNPYSSVEYSKDVVGITSLVGNNGEWKEDFFCPAAAAGGPETKLIAVGFQLRSETSTGVKDDTAGNNMKLVCSDLYQKQGYTYIEGDGTERGEWTERQLCWPGYGICGLQTQVEVSRSMDTTGLNNLKVRCCRVESGINFQVAANATTSLQSASNSEESSSSAASSASGEKDKQNNRTRGDHATSVEIVTEDYGVNRLGASQEMPDEQELIAIVDPEAAPFSKSWTSYESPVGEDLPTHNATEVEAVEMHSSSSSIEVNQHQHSDSSEDENLSAEISQIDQLDNSEAHQDEEEPVSIATDSEQQHGIPEEVVNALEDADSTDSSSSYEENQHPYNNKPFHWGTEIANATQSGEYEHGTNTIDAEPKSSPRSGQIEGNSTNVIPISNHASHHNCMTWQTLAIGSMVMLYIFKLQ